MAGAALWARAATPVDSVTSVWRFEDASNIGLDGAGSVNLRAVAGATGAPELVADGRRGNAVRIAREHDTIGYAMVSDVTPISGSGPCTFGFWLRPNSVSHNTAYLAIQKKIGTGAPNAWTNANWTKCWYVRFAGDGKLQFHFHEWISQTDNGDKSILATIPTGTYKDGKWHHVAFTHDGAGAIALYWDGEKVGEKTIPGFEGASGTGLLIGSYQKSNSFSGDYDEITIRNYAMTPEQVEADFRFGGAAYFGTDGTTGVDVPSGETEVVKGGIPDGVTVVKTGEGALDLTEIAAGNSPGGVDVQAGTVRAAVVDAVPSGSVSVAAGSVFDFARGGAFNGTVSGEGTMRFSGLTAARLGGEGSLGITGKYELYAANVDFGTEASPLAPAAGAALDVANSGSLNFFGDVFVRSISGNGTLGAVTIAAGKTVSITGDGDAEYAGRLEGEGTFAKNGTGELKLATTPAAGTLSVNAGAVTLQGYARGVQDGLIAGWRFEDAENLGKDLAGSRPLQPAMTDDGAVVQIANGMRGKALSLRGESKKPACAMVAPVGTTPTGTDPFTVACWLRPASGSPATAYLVVCRTSTGGKPGAWSGAVWDGWNIRFVKGGYAVSVDFQNKWRDHVDDAQCVQGSIGSACHADGKWHHLAVTRDGSSKVTLYWDGKAVGSKQLTVNQNIASSVRLSFGGQDSGNSFSGDYDDALVYNRALTAEEIGEIYAKPGPEIALPPADGHWTFDEIAEEGDAKFFRDSSGNGLDFANLPNPGGHYVECVRGEGINGGAAYVREQGTSLQLAEGKTIEPLVNAAKPTFTFSARIRNASASGAARKPFLCMGNAQTAEKCFRLSHEGRENYYDEPQTQRVLFGEGNNKSGYALTDTFSTAGEDATWTTITVVHDTAAKRLKIYRDGVLVREEDTTGERKAGTCIDFDVSRFDIGWNTYSYFSGVMIDDLRVWKDVTLDEEQIKLLVREQAGIARDGRHATSVAVANGAGLTVAGGAHRLKSVSGAGAVTVGETAALDVLDWSGFGGTLSGSGRLMLHSALPAGIALGECIPVVAGVVAKADGSSLPVVSVAGKLELAKNGEVRFVDAAGNTVSPNSGRYVIAEAGEFTGVGDLSGWTLANAHPGVPYEFKIRDGKFMLSVKGGMCIIIR